MSWRRTAKAPAYLAVVAVGLVAAVVLHQPAAALVVLPFAAALLVGLAVAPRPELRVALTPTAGQVVEGDTIELGLTLSSTGAAAAVELALAPGPGLRLLDEPDALPAALRLDADEPRHLAIGLAGDHWGRPQLGRLALRARDPGGFVVAEQVWTLDTRIRVLPDTATLRHVLAPLDTRTLTGAHLTRRRGQGIEFADVRPLGPGEHARDVNWRRSARSDELWVNTRHPERSSDVVVFVDTFGDAALDPSIRAAAAVAAEHLRRRDRVGVVTFGGTVQWLHPAGGTRQLHRMLDVLLSTAHLDNQAGRDLTRLPSFALPPSALVVAVSALDDERSASVLRQLAARHVDLGVVTLCTERAPRSSAPADVLAWRIWALERRAAVDDLRRAGIATADWYPDEPLAPVLRDLQAARRRLRVRR